MPVRENLKKTVRRTRQDQLPPNPKSLADLQDLPPEYTKTFKDEAFLLYDSRSDPAFEHGRVLVFSTRKNLEMLSKSSTWFVDGTFKVAPSMFVQMFAILGIVSQASRRLSNSQLALPFVYALLSGKETPQYEAVFQAINTTATRYGIQFQPTRIMGDFEAAIIAACRSTYPNVPIAGCYFHLCQSMYRRIIAEGLQTAYTDKNNTEVRTKTHMLLALAFVPVEDVENTFEELRETMPDSMINVVDYFELNYIHGRQRRNGRGSAPPRFPLSLWNQREATITGQHRTNNVSEGWHHRFALMVGKSHPSLFSLLSVLQKEQHDVDGSIVEVGLGRLVRAKQRRKTAALQAQLEAVTLDYKVCKDEDRVLEFLTNIGCNISL